MPSPLESLNDRGKIWYKTLVSHQSNSAEIALITKDKPSIERILIIDHFLNSKLFNALADIVHRLYRRITSTLK